MAEKANLSGDSTPRVTSQTAPPTATATVSASEENSRKDGKGKMRNIFGFGKKKPEAPETAATSVPALSKDSSKLSSATHSTMSSSPPRRSPYEHSIAIPASPTHGFGSSPRAVSPATSQIFERDVQDSAFLPRPTSSAIPNHIQTENYIPSVLDDASEAITNSRLDPDAVEIVTHSSHQPAAVTVTGSVIGTGTGTGIGTGASTLATPSPYDQTSNEWASELASFADRIVGQPAAADSASNYGSLDSSDVRRLSFISFADVVQSEHHGAHHLVHVKSRENLHMAGLTSLSPSALNRSPSPIRSPVSSQGPGTSPPTSNPGSIKGLDLSPSRKPLGSPTCAGLPHAGHGLAPADLNIETMTQALKRTGSTDLSRYRSSPQSPIDGPGSR